MEDIVLIIIACCLLFGAEKTKKGIGVVLKVIGIGILILIGLSFLGSFLPDTDQTSGVTQEQQEEYTVVTVEELKDAWSKDYAYAKELYNGKKVSITGKIGTPYEEFDISIMPYITSTESTDQSTWIPLMTESDKLSEQFQTAEGTVKTVKGVLWVANDEDFGLDEEDEDDDLIVDNLIDDDYDDFGLDDGISFDDEDESSGYTFAIILMVDSVE